MQEDCVLPYLIEAQAAANPDRIFAVFEDGEAASWAEIADAASRAAAALRRLGLAADGKLLSWMPNGRLGLMNWFSANYLGAVSVGLNIAYRGGLLAHAVRISDAEIMVGHPDLIDRLLELDDRAGLRTVLTDPAKAARDRAAFAQRGMTLLPWSLLAEGDPDPALPVAGLMPWTTQSICFTSGTTGPSKAVLSSYRHLYLAGIHCLPGFTRDDRYMINLPLFHAGGTLAVSCALARGGSIALIGGFRSDDFLDLCARLEATATILLGVMASFLLRRPPSPADRAHRLRLAMVLPATGEQGVLTERFGFEVVTVFNMSETAGPIRTVGAGDPYGSCGKPRPGIEARIVDDNDCQLPTGRTGELVLRADQPWEFSHGYHRMPEATALAWRNGWFHTGDAMRMDADGYFYFVDRVKDAIRRRGENISSFEVEQEVLAHPDVLEAAAVGVPSDLSEEDVMVVIALKPDCQIAPEAMIEFLRQRMPHYMVPRYLRFVAELPKTPTAKVQKHVLRAQAGTADRWDRELAGIRIGRERLSG